jgi:dienelactone hydrolase
VQVGVPRTISLRVDVLLVTESDFTFPTEFRRRAEDILVEKAQYQIQVFSGVKHGFAVRGDLENSVGRSCSFYLILRTF